MTVQGAGLLQPAPLVQQAVHANAIAHPMHEQTLNHFFLPRGNGERLCTYHAPAGGEAAACVVQAHAFGEEMNKCRRMSALQAAAMAGAGCAVLQIDLAGCGDSSDVPDDMGWETWLDDLQAACDWICKRHADAPLWLWGQRTGALLASALAARRAEPTHLLLWQPMSSGRTLVQQLLRLKGAAHLGDGAAAKAAMAAARAELVAGRALSVAGYTLPAALLQAIEQATLQPPPAPGRTAWLELSSRAEAALAPASAKLIEDWQAAGHVVHARCVAGPAFWQSAEIEHAPELIPATVAALGLNRALPLASGGQQQAAAPIGSEARANPLLYVQESCIRFDCCGDALVGIVSTPAAPSRVGLVIIVGGPQYRVGSHRQFVLLARHLAAAGHAVLRFDVRGMGDSAGAPRAFDDQDSDIAAAVAALRHAVPQVQQIALWGLCDGASAALLYAGGRPDPALAGLCLLNPWVRSVQTQAATQVKHYYAQRVMQPAFWAKMLRGGVGLARVGELIDNIRQMRRRGESGAAGTPSTFQQRMAHAWRQCTTPRLLLLSGQDLTAREFTEALASDPNWQGALQHPALTRLDLPQADHTFSDDAARTAVEEATARWLQSLAAAHAPAS